LCTQAQVESITEKIAATAEEVFGSRLSAVFLYGSYARGDYDEESDLDIMVLADVKKEDLYKYKASFIKLSSDLGLLFDMLITITLKDTETFYTYSDSPPFYNNVLKEGIKIA